MKVLLLEDNLMWSVRVRNGLEALGHSVAISTEAKEADLAIVNLSARAFDPLKAVNELKKMGVQTIGHVGHKEKEIWNKGKEAGCDVVVSNGTLANRLSSVIDDIVKKSE